MDKPDSRTVAAVGLGFLALVPSVYATSADDVARAAIAEFARGDIAAAVARLDPKTLPPDAEGVGRQIHDLLVQVGIGAPARQVSWSGFRSFTRDLQRDEFAYHVLGKEVAALVFVTAETIGGKTMLTKFRCEPAPVDLRDRYPFVLSGMSSWHYILILAMCTSLAIMLTATALCLKGPARRKWLWVPFILVGVGSVGLSWIPGDLQRNMLRVQPLSIRLLGVAFVKYPLYDPWQLFVSLPVGAVTFLLWRPGERSIRHAVEQADAADERHGPTGGARS